MNVELRDPNIIMKLSRLGSFHQSKLSFLRSFLSEFKDWDYKRDLFELDSQGFGVAVYSFKKKDRVYSLVCFANRIDDHERSDRVIATKWDAAFTLHDGIPTKEDINRLKNEVPRQEVGRLSYKELTLSRANKSIRIFDHVVESLSKGEQPNLELLAKVGYLYRTTAVYGSGKFGLADRFRIKNRHEINGPFRLEMMLVYLVRQFTFDQVNHVAKSKNPQKAIKLDPKICKNLGIGNSTGLGMAPFIVNHPTLLNNWILCRETALKKIREIKKVKQKDSELFKRCIENSITNITSWNTESEFQLKKIKSLYHDIKKFLIFLENFNFLLSILLVSIPVLAIYYLTSSEIYRTDSLIEIQNESKSFLPSSLDDPLGTKKNSLAAEIEIYKSNSTVVDALSRIKNNYDFDEHPSAEEVRNNLSFSNDNKSLITITFFNGNPDYVVLLLNELTSEFINDRVDFKKKSSAAGKSFIRNEIPRIKDLLKNAEKNLNDFKLSTNASDIIFDTNTRNFKLEQLRNRVNEIEFKELSIPFPYIIISPLIFLMKIPLSPFSMPQ